LFAQQVFVQPPEAGYLPVHRPGIYSGINQVNNPTPDHTVIGISSFDTGVLGLQKSLELSKIGLVSLQGIEAQSFFKLKVFQEGIRHAITRPSIRAR
jgi:hypothetical protein